MGRKLDRSKKFSTTYGEDSRRFYQDGIYFDAGGDEVVSETPVVPDIPLGSGQPAGKVPAGAASATVSSSGAPRPATPEELRAQLEGLNFGQIKKLFVKGQGPEEIKGPGSRGRMIDWLVENRDKLAA